MLSPVVKACVVQYKPPVKVIAVDPQLLGVPRKYQLSVDDTDDELELLLDELLEVVLVLPPHAGQGTPTTAPAWNATASWVFTLNVALPLASTVMLEPLQAPVL